MPIKRTQRQAIITNAEGEQIGKVKLTKIGQNYDGILTVTPAMAEVFIDEMADNRNPRNRHIESLIGAMERGEWKENGDSLRFNVDDQMVDGQHRCWASVESDKKFKTKVVFGLDREDYIDTIDRNAIRTAGDTLNILGEKNYSALASALSWLYRLKNKLPATASSTPAQSRVLLTNNPLLRDSVEKILAHKFLRRFGGAMAALHYLFHQKDRNLADSFMERLGSGALLQPDEALFHLRRRLEEDMMNKERKLKTELKLLYIIHAWNHTRKGSKLNKLMRPKTEGRPEID